jgi:hypothetical protein
MALLFCAAIAVSLGWSAQVVAASAHKTASPKTQLPAGARANPLLGGSSQPPSLPAGAPGKLTVVASGSPTQRPTGPHTLLLPVVLRDNTTKPVSGIQVTAKATASGKLVATGNSQLDLYPQTVEPGQIAFGGVYFQTAPPSSAAITYSITTGNSTAVQDVGLLVTASDTAQKGGGFLSMTGTVKNTTKEKITSPARVFGMCFSSSGQPTGTLDTSTDGNAIPPGAQTTFSYQVSGQGITCASWLVAAAGSDTHF